MSQIWNRFRFFVSDAVDEWRYSPGVNLLATFTLAFALLLAGLALVVLANVGGWIERLKSESPVHVFLRDDIPAESRAELEARLRSAPGVASVAYVDKEEALRRFRVSFGDLAEATAELGGNPLPASMEIALSPGEEGARAAESLVRSFSEAEGVEDVRYDRAWLDRVDAILKVARGGGAGLGLLVFGAVSFVMASVLRLAVYARRDEIEIMLLVGASPMLVRGPFLVAGVVQGFVASVISLGMLEVMRRAALVWAEARPGAISTLLIGRPLGPPFELLIVAVGCAVGLAGSYLAVRRFS